jgi:monovalent cation:H+ antiporter, CPA1 family
MSLQYLIAILICVTAAASYINFRYIKLPKSIGLTILTLAISLIILTLISFSQHWALPVKKALSGINFNATVMDGMLSFLLFASALHINTLEMSKHKKTISALATASVFLTCILLGYTTWYVTNWLGHPIDLLPCLLFGALIAPTDPVAVLAVMKRTCIPNSIRMKITGESLFNDAVGIILFVLISQLVTGEIQHLQWKYVAILLVREGFGGIALGYGLGILTSYFLRRANHDETAITITLALVTGGYALATAIHVSGPIAMVVAGLVIGDQCRKPHFSSNTVKRLYSFWGLVDDILNSFLFSLIGLEMLSLKFDSIILLLGLMAFVLLIVVRVISVTIPIVLLEKVKKDTWKMLSVMTWGGMRGGLSIALALSIPDITYKGPIISITYTVVVLSIIIQGLSLQPLVNRLFPSKKQVDAIPDAGEKSKDSGAILSKK